MFVFFIKVKKQYNVCLKTRLKLEDFFLMTETFFVVISCEKWKMEGNGGIWGGFGEDLGMTGGW